MLDVAWRDGNLVCTVGQDGTLRQFDVRDPHRSQILYELRVRRDRDPVAPEVSAPLYRLGVCRSDNNYVSLLAQRAQSSWCWTCNGAARLRHAAGTRTAPTSCAGRPMPQVASGGDDRMVVLWDLKSTSAARCCGAELQYAADAPVSALQWSERTRTGLLSAPRRVSCCAL